MLTILSIWTLLGWIGLVFLAVNFLVLTILSVWYIRIHWKAVDAEMAAEQAASKAFRDRLDTADKLLDCAFKSSGDEEII